MTNGMRRETTVRSGSVLLSLENVSAGYGGADVVRNISFRVNAGENLSVIGPNGCGKTTLLKAIANVLPYSGEIAVNGQNLQIMKRREIAKKIAMMSQTSGIYFTYSVFDTVMMGRYPHISDRLSGRPAKEDIEYVLCCLKAVNLLAEKDRQITQLSGGQLQRVFLARTLAQEPDIILLDEPTNHLDLKYQIELIEYLREWAARGRRAVIGVLHDINLAIRLADTQLVMRGGEIQAGGRTCEILTDELLERVFETDVAGYMREALRRWIICQ